MRVLVFFLILAVSIGASFVAWRVMQKSGEPAPKTVVVEPKVIEKEVPTFEIVVARNDIPIGSRMTAEMLDTRPWPQTLMPEGNVFVMKEQMATSVVGMVARSNVRKGEPVLSNLLGNPGDPSFLAASLKEGMRAVTIQIDGISGIAGFVYPGDVVDVMINHDITLPGDEVNEVGQVVKSKPQSVTEVLVRDVRVLAIDQRFTVAAGSPPTPGSSATVEVSPIDAQKLRLGESKGRLSMVLKPLRKADEEDVASVVARPVGVGDLSRVTPPSIFPVLYEGGDRIVPRTVQLAGTAEPQIEKVQESKNEEDEVKDLMDEMPVSTKVSLVRGVQEEVKGAK